MRMCTTTNRAGTLSASLVSGHLECLGHSEASHEKVVELGGKDHSGFVLNSFCRMDGYCVLDLGISHKSPSQLLGVASVQKKHLDSFCLVLAQVGLEPEGLNLIKPANVFV